MADEASRRVVNLAGATSDFAPQAQGHSAAQIPLSARAFCTCPVHADHVGQAELLHATIGADNRMWHAGRHCPCRLNVPKFETSSMRAPVREGSVNLTVEVLFRSEFL